MERRTHDTHKEVYKYFTRLPTRRDLVRSVVGRYGQSRSPNCSAAPVHLRLRLSVRLLRHLQWQLHLRRCPLLRAVLGAQVPVALVRRFLARLDEAALAAAVRRAIAEDLSLSEAMPQVVAALAPLASGWSAFDETTRRNAAAAYKELEWE